MYGICTEYTLKPCGRPAYIFLSIHPSIIIYLCIYLSIYLFRLWSEGGWRHSAGCWGERTCYTSIFISIHLSITIYLSISLSIYLSIYLGYGRKDAVDILLAAGGNVPAIHLFFYLSIYLTMYLSIQVMVGRRLQTFCWLLGGTYSLVATGVLSPSTTPARGHAEVTNCLCICIYI